MGGTGGEVEGWRKGAGGGVDVVGCCCCCGAMGGGFWEGRGLGGIVVGGFLRCRTP